MSKFTLRWGILATGGIAETFSRDLTVNPETRGINDIQHEIVAAASSSSADRASQFLKKVGAPSSAKSYGSYEELVADKNVDIIYVATPHSHHYQHAMLALEAGKNVLCEKAFTTNAAQTKLLVEKAREKKLFLMEAVWTRYFPLSIYIRDVITSGKIGKVQRTFADLSIGTIPEEAWDDSHRMVNPDLAGGALLDLGIYALTWVFQTLYHTQPESERKAPTVVSALRKYTTGADEMTTMILTFPRSKELGGDAHGIASTSMRVSSDPDGKGSAGPSIRVQGDKGEVQVFHPAFRPTKTRLILPDGTVEDKEFAQPGPGHGMFWEADECAFALKEGRKEGKYESLTESVVIMETMDEVRKQAGLTYPEKIESTKYPEQL